MAQVTVELRKLLELNNFDLFDFDYQVDDPSFKQEVEQKIIDYYYYYEIGSPTVDQFKHRFRTRFLRAIGYYNKLYNTTLLEYNPLINYSMKEALEQLASTSTTQGSNSTITASGTTTADNTTTTEQESDNTSNTKTSDYPQQSIAGGDFLNGESESTSTDNSTNTTTTNATASNDDSTQTTGNVNTTGSTDTTYEKTIEGLTGVSYQELIQKERETILRIPNMIIQELKPCFILVH